MLRALAGVAAFVFITGLVEGSGMSGGARLPIVTVQVSPARVAAAARSPITFRFQAGPVRVRRVMLMISVPSGWATPTRNMLGAGYVSATAGVVSISGSVVRIRGIDLAAGSALVVRYGGGPGGATEPYRKGPHAFSVAAVSGATRVLADTDTVHVSSPHRVCATTRSSARTPRPLLLPDGSAQANLHNARAWSGLVTQCFAPNGLTTDVELSGLRSRRSGPAGYPEAVYGHHLLDEPFCRGCPAGTFPMPVARLISRRRDYWLTVRYALGAAVPASLPRDFMYDLWFERHPSPGRPPQPGDVEMILFLYYRNGIVACLDAGGVMTFSRRIWANGRVMSSRWRVCSIYGGTSARAIAVFLVRPRPVPAGKVSLRLADFERETSAYLGRSLREYSVMGIELGGEFDQCTYLGTCAAPAVRWSWRISELVLGDVLGRIPIVFSSGK